MTRTFFIAIIFILSVGPVSAQDVGIKFDDMQVGTTLVTQSISGSKRVKFEKYIGRQGDFHVMEESTKKGSAPIKSQGNTYYDLAGREVKADWFDGPAHYEPYSCEFVTGKCTHTLDYPNPLTKKKIKRTRSTRTYSNRLEGDTFIVSWKLANGKTAEFPYKLGPYNFRVSINYTNALGKERGFELVEIIEPIEEQKQVAEQTAPEKVIKKAKSFSPECMAVYDRLRAQTPGDISKCTPTVKEARFDQCRLPSTTNSERHPSHVVMILDASGSMAGKIGGKQKMASAKREAGKFLSDLAKDVPIGLIVYGHRGTNKESGKAVSCAGVEWALPIGARRSRVRASIKQLDATGWTPMGGALEFAKVEIDKLSINKDGKESTPVIYLISDGKETCGGDPAAAAKALHETGTKTLVNVIGFDVDSKTRSALEAISQAGGGRYFAAKDASALRKHLRAAADAVGSKNRFETCKNLNQGFAETVYNRASGSVPACFVRESERKTRNVILEKVKAFTEETDIACARTVKELARREWSANIKKMSKLYRGLLRAQREAGQAARERSLREALPAK